MWRAPDDPQIYGALDIDAGPLLRFIARAEHAGQRVTPTHLVGRALAYALEMVPDLNVSIHGGSARPRPSVDIFFITAVSSGRDLSGVKIEDVPYKTAVDVATELTHKSRELKQGTDREFRRTKSLMDHTPMFLLRSVLRLSATLTETLGLDLPVLGLHKAPFGSAMVTSVGMFGLPQGFAPIAWMYDVPVLVLVGELTERPVVVDGRVEARTILPITATIDHRYVDGWHVSRAMAAFREYLASPDLFEPLADAPREPLPRAEHERMASP